jgi:hypothetical protein
MRKKISFLFLICPDRTESQGKEHTQKKKTSFLFLICPDRTESQGKEHTQKKKNFLSVSDLPRSHRVAGQRAYAEMKGIDPVIKKAK